MTHDPVCVSEETPLEEALNVMRSRQIRRLVVINSTRELVGLFALDAMLELLGDEQQSIARLVRTIQSR